MTDQWIVNPRMPTTPFPPRFERIRKAGLAKWGDAPVTEEKIREWACAGCPDETGALLNVGTRQPPLAGQGQSDPSAFVKQLLEYRVFRHDGKL